ncbi:Golgi-associated plant pathogenesis-related protein 1 [Orchesella cincta]|uniref:Golgi-associated plant pathogenesis-related protein 1 n=1 Tax=Orchesella cincta TaxID=48709 RepID=A0A1D2NMP2_ORCCI|nr:Golgi-associated plant pathogenesis-related protein 1 [Orchesella cincta]
MDFDLFGKSLIVFISLLQLQLCCGQEAYQQKALDLHNQYRATHHSPALTSDNTLNSNAVKCAQWYADQQKIDHKCPYKNGTGENLSAGNGGNWSNDQWAELSTKMWYDEVKYYNYSNPGFSGKTGHFTQVVWKNSQRLGFGYVQKNGYTVGVALYSPPGNYQGQFPQNVLRP